MADQHRSRISDVVIRDAHESDWQQIWPIVHEIITAQQSFPYDPFMGECEAHQVWMTPAPGRVSVAVQNSAVLGSANMYANYAGPGSHIASGSVMVAEQARGIGVGRALTLDMVAWAQRHSFSAIQFNAVVSTNVAAIGLYTGLGFVTLGSAPRAFRHPTYGDVDVLMMWLDLRGEDAR